MGILNDPNKADLKEYYDKIAAKYNICHGSSLYGTEYNIKNNYLKLFQEHIVGDEVALEIGSGTGRFSSVLGQMIRRLFCMDFSYQMLKQDSSPYPKVVGDSECLPFANNIVDLVVGIVTFSYYSNKAECLKEIRRVLKPRGKLILLDQNFLSPIFYMMLIFYFKKRRKNFNRHLFESNRFTLSSILKKAGFSVEQIQSTSWVPHTLGKNMVKFLIPFDKILSVIPIIKNLSLRIFIVGVKK